MTQLSYHTSVARTQWHAKYNFDGRILKLIGQIRSFSPSHELLHSHEQRDYASEQSRRAIDCAACTNGPIGILVALFYALQSMP